MTVLGAIEHSQPGDSVQLIHHNVQGLLSKVTPKSHNGFIGVKTILLFCVVVRPGLKISHYCQHLMGIRGFILLCSYDLVPQLQFLPGSSLFVSSDLQPQQIDACRSVTRECSVLNVCCCLITCKARRVAIISVYRSLSVSIKSALKDFRLVLQGLLPYVNSFIIIAGDVNISLLSDSCDVGNYIDLLSDFYLQQHVCQPTRITETSATLIDHVIASKDIPVFTLLQSCGLSDHKVQIASFALTTVRHLQSIGYVRSFRRCDWEKLHDALCSAPWQTMNVFDDINDKWFYFCTLLQNCLDKFLPLKRVNVHKARRPTPWFTDTISASIQNKNN